METKKPEYIDLEALGRIHLFESGGRFGACQVGGQYGYWDGDGGDLGRGGGQQCWAFQTEAERMSTLQLLDLQKRYGRKSAQYEYAMKTIAKKETLRGAARNLWNVMRKRKEIHAASTSH